MRTLLFDEYRKEFLVAKGVDTHDYFVDVPVGADRTQLIKSEVLDFE